MWFHRQNSVSLHTPFLLVSCAISERRTFLSLPDIITSPPTPTRQPISFIYIAKCRIISGKVFNIQSPVSNCCLVMQPLTMLSEMSILNIASTLPWNKLTSVKSPLWKVHGAEALRQSWLEIWTLSICLTPTVSVSVCHFPTDLAPQFHKKFTFHSRKSCTLLLLYLSSGKMKPLPSPLSGKSHLRATNSRCVGGACVQRSLLKLTFESISRPAKKLFYHQLWVKFVLFVAKRSLKHEIAVFRSYRYRSFSMWGISHTLAGSRGIPLHYAQCNLSGLVKCVNKETFVQIGCSTVWMPWPFR